MRILAAGLLFALLLSAPVRAASRSVAVFTFENLTGSGDHDWVGVGFAEALSDKLRALDRLRVRGRREIADLARVAHLDASRIRTKHAGELGRLVGSDYLVFGAVQAAGPVDKPDSSLRATARIVDVRTGRVHDAVQVDGAMGDLFSLQTRLALAFARQLQDEVSEAAKRSMAHHGTDNLAAYRAYCEGIRLLDAEAYDKAIDAFREALRLHPGVLYAEAHHALGTAFLRSGKTAQMLREFRRDAATLSPIWFDLGVAYEKAGDLDKAAEAFRTFVHYTDHRYAPWRYRAAKEAPLPNADGDWMLLPGANGELHAVECRSGRLRWRKRLPPLSRAATLSGAYGYFGTADGRLCCVNGLTGELRWDTRLDAPATTAPRVLPEAGRVAVGTADGAVVAADLDTGKVLWKRSLAGSPTAARHDARALYLGDDRGSVYAVGLDDGELLWQRRAARSIRGAEREGGHLYVAGDDGTLRCLSLEDGRPLWTFQSTERVFAPPAREGAVALRTDGTLVALDGAGKERWTHTPARAIGCLAAGEGVVAYALEGAAEVILLDVRDGRIAERRPTDAPVREIVVGRGVALTRSEDGTITALGLGAATGAVTDRDGYLRLAAILREKGETEAAIQTYRLILSSVDDRSGEALAALAELYRKTGREAEAEDMRRRLRGSMPPRDSSLPVPVEGAP